jgi:hypothetical protein
VTRTIVNGLLAGIAIPVGCVLWALGKGNLILEREAEDRAESNRLTRLEKWAQEWQRRAPRGNREK